MASGNFKELFETLKNDLAFQQTQYDQCLINKLELWDDYENLKKFLDDLTKDFEDALNYNKTLNDELDKRKSDENTAKDTIVENLESTVNELKANLQETENRLSTAVEDLRLKTEELSQCQAENTLLNSHLLDIRSDYEKIKTEFAEKQRQMKALQQQFFTICERKEETYGQLDSKYNRLLSIIGQFVDVNCLKLEKSSSSPSHVTSTASQETSRAVTTDSANNIAAGYSSHVTINTDVNMDISPIPTPNNDVTLIVGNNDVIKNDDVMMKSEVIKNDDDVIPSLSSSADEKNLTNKKECCEKLRQQNQLLNEQYEKCKEKLEKSRKLSTDLKERVKKMKLKMKKRRIDETPPTTYDRYRSHDVTNREDDRNGSSRRSSASSTNRNPTRHHNGDSRGHVTNDYSDSPASSSTTANQRRGESIRERHVGTRSALVRSPDRERSPKRDRSPYRNNYDRQRYRYRKRTCEGERSSLEDGEINSFYESPPRKRRSRHRSRSRSSDDDRRRFKKSTNRKRPSNLRSRAARSCSRSPSVSSSSSFNSKFSSRRSKTIDSARLAHSSTTDEETTPPGCQAPPPAPGERFASRPITIDVCDEKAHPQPAQFDTPPPATNQNRGGTSSSSDKSASAASSQSGKPITFSGADQSAAAPPILSLFDKPVKFKVQAVKQQPKNLRTGSPIVPTKNASSINW